VFVKTIQGIQDTKCAQFEIVHITDHSGIRVYVALWAGAIGSFALTIPMMTLLWFPKACSWFQHGIGKVSVALVWFASWVLILVACEFASNNFRYKGPTDTTVTRLTSNEFAFGQVIAVVMLFSQLWDIAVYPFHESDESQGGKRIVYWYRTRLRPAYRSLFGMIPEFEADMKDISKRKKRLKKGMAVFLEMRKKFQILSPLLRQLMILRAGNPGNEVFMLQRSAKSVYFNYTMYFIMRAYLEIHQMAYNIISLLSARTIEHCASGMR
jgi:hypothetical protein